MKKNTIKLTEAGLRKMIYKSVKSALQENTTPSERVKAGNQQYARPEQLNADIKKIPTYYDELVNNGKTYVSWADVYFDEWLIKNHPELNYDVRPCADFYERTLFFLTDNNQMNEARLRKVIKEEVEGALSHEKIMPKRVYIVFDGTSYYAIYGFEVEDEIKYNDVEVVKGPFDSMNGMVEDLVDRLNDEAYSRERY